MISSDKIEVLLDKKFIRVYDLKYEEGKHYMNASRRPLERLACTYNDEDFKKMLPDAVTCIVIISNEGEEDKLLLSREYRYPAGQFLISPPAGLLDPEDECGDENPIIAAAKREIEEETGLVLDEDDEIRIINPLLFSTPGMTDESNALVKAVVHNKGQEALSQEGAVGSELFDGFLLLNREEAKRILLQGCDDEGIFYSMYTWAALMVFVNEKC